MPKHLSYLKKAQPLLNKNRVKNFDIKGGSQKMAVMVIGKNVTTTIKVKLVQEASLPELLLINFKAINHHSQFLTATSTFSSRSYFKRATPSL